MQITIREAIKCFIDEKQSQDWTQGVVNRYKVDLDRFARFCDQAGINHLHDIKLPILTAYRATWKLTYPSASTRRKTQTRIRSFFRYAVAAEWIQHSCAQAMSTINVDPRPTMPLEPAEYKTLLSKTAIFSDTIVRRRMEALVQLQRHTGLAIADAVNLSRSQIQFHEKKRLWRVLTSRAKTDVPVYVPIREDLADELLALPGTSLFPESVSQYHRRYRKLFDAAGIVDGHSHQLRDTAAVEWLKAGIPIEEVSRLLGHDSINTTEKHYAPWVTSRQDRLDKIVTSTW